MKRNTLHTLLVALLALTFAACGGSEDPAGDGGNNGGNNGGNTNNGDPNNGDPNNGDTNNGDTNNGDTNNGDPNNGDPNNGDPNNGVDPNNGDPGECNENLTYTGQVFAEMGNPLSPNGGVPTTSAYSSSYDSGLEAVVAAVPAAGEDNDDTMDVVENEATVDLEVTGATVVASYFNSDGQPVPRANRQFWIQDGKAAIQVFFPAGEEGDEIRMMHPDFNIKVGQKISFRATKVTNFNGVAEVTGVEPGSWALESEDNEVYLDDRTGDNITLADVNRLVRVTGTLTGPGTACGTDYMCYDLDFGAANTVALRTNSQFVMSGDCVTYVGPVGAFGGAPQLNVANFDWLRSPFRE